MTEGHFVSKRPLALSGAAICTAVRRPHASWSPRLKIERALHVDLPIGHYRTARANIGHGFRLAK